jgi:hypothetical protein
VFRQDGLSRTIVKLQVCQGGVHWQITLEEVLVSVWHEWTVFSWSVSSALQSEITRVEWVLLMPGQWHPTLWPSIWIVRELTVWAEAISSDWMWLVQTSTERKPNLISFVGFLPFRGVVSYWDRIRDCFCCVSKKVSLNLVLFVYWPQGI